MRFSAAYLQGLSANSSFHHSPLGGVDRRCPRCARSKLAVTSGSNAKTLEKDRSALKRWVGGVGGAKCSLINSVWTNGVSFPDWHYNLSQMRDFLKETLHISLVAIYLLKVNRLYFLNNVLKILKKR